MRFTSQIVKYGLVGLINTGVGFVAIAALALSGVPPFIANACGYAAGLLISFVLNAKFTFGSKLAPSTLAAFIAGFCVCYSINLAVLFLTAPLADTHILLPQLLAVLTYNLFFFLLMKHVIFSPNEA